ncbi:MAG: phosphoribosylamine--glycine ligase, partial [Nanoarchaeota archaeon]
MVKVLIAGSGGREHALGWKLSQSTSVTDVIYAPGNGGTAGGKCRNVDIDCTKPANFPTLADLVEKESIDQVIVGPEGPLSEGIVDFFNARGYNRIFGPTKAASALEADKFFSHYLVRECGVPQATSLPCESLESTLRAIHQLSTNKGIVLKARGLTGGKGVTVCDTQEHALAELSNHHSAYGPHILVAERLFGPEFSVFGISDGNKVVPFSMAFQDHKRQLDGDKGPNTGGMGAYGPVPFVDAAMVHHIADTMMTPVIRKMKEMGHEYKGFLYAGMMLTEQGPKVIEFNVRFGDPECQPAMTMLKSNLHQHINDALDGKLRAQDFEYHP